MFRNTERSRKSPCKHEVGDPDQNHGPLGINHAPLVIREQRAAGKSAAERELADASRRASRESS